MNIIDYVEFETALIITSLFVRDLYRILGEIGRLNNIPYMYKKNLFLYRYQTIYQHDSSLGQDKLGQMKKISRILICIVVDHLHQHIE